MQTEIKTVQEAAIGGWTHEVTVEYTDTAAAATTQTLALLNVIEGDLIERVGVEVVTSYDGGATSALFLTIGDGGDLDRFVGDDNAGTPNAIDIHADGTPVSVSADTTGQGTVPHLYTAADTIDAYFTATGANMSVLTQGKLIIRFRISNTKGDR